MRVAFYARVSTERQEQQGTIASQLDALRRFAQEHGDEVVDAYVCVDDGYSGSRLDRPGLDRLRDGAAAAAFEAVLILCPDRLARKYAYQVLILEELERFGVRALFLEQPPSEDPHARLLVQIQGAIAEYERMKIAERHRRGKLFRARQGEVVCWKVPYGYRRIPRRDGVPAHVEIAEPEAQVVRQIFAWHVHERLSIRQIARRLTESAHPSATGLTRWGLSTVGRMLRNEAYVGRMYFNRNESLDGDPKTAGRRRTLKSRTRRRPASEWVPLSVPPLISEELFQRSQALHHYYYCGGHDLLRARRRIGRCSQRHIRADELDALVWAEVRRHLESPALILEAYTRLRAEPAPRPDDLVAQEVLELQKKLAEADREEHRLLDAYQAGLIALNQLERRQGLLRQRRAHVAASLEAARGEHAAALQRADLELSVERFARDICGPLAMLPFEDRQRLVRTVIERVMVEEGQVDLHFAIPLPEPPTGDPADRPEHVSTDFRLRSHHNAKRTLTTEGGQARQLADRPASLRSVHDAPIWAFTIERSGCSASPKCAFFAARHFISLVDLNAQLAQWIEEVAHARVVPGEPFGLLVRVTVRRSACRVVASSLPATCTGGRSRSDGGGCPERTVDDEAVRRRLRSDLLVERRVIKRPSSRPRPAP